MTENEFIGPSEHLTLVPKQNKTKQKKNENFLKILTPCKFFNFVWWKMDVETSMKEAIQFFEHGKYIFYIFLVLP